MSDEQWIHLPPGVRTHGDPAVSLYAAVQTLALRNGGWTGAKGAGCPPRTHWVDLDPYIWAASNEVDVADAREALTRLEDGAYLDVAPGGSAMRARLVNHGPGWDSFDVTGHDLPLPVGGLLALDQERRWHEFLRSRSIHIQDRPGYVYVGETTTPGLFKVGRSGAPTKRVSKLTGPGGRPVSLVCEWHVSDMVAAESAMHEILDRRRYLDEVDVCGIEWFECSLDLVKQAAIDLELAPGTKSPLGVLPPPQRESKVDWTKPTVDHPLDHLEYWGSRFNNQVRTVSNRQRWFLASDFPPGDTCPTVDADSEARAAYETLWKAAVTYRSNDGRGCMGWVAMSARLKYPLLRAAVDRLFDSQLVSLDTADDGGPCLILHYPKEQAQGLASPVEAVAI